MRSPLRFFTGLAVAAALVFAGASAASAHDELVASDPGDRQQLNSAPEQITLTYSAEILTDPGTATILVVDGSGTDWAAGSPVIEGTVATVALKADMPDAGYEVRWRVVSSDGHPISGVVPFTVGDARPLAPSDGSTPEAPATTDAATPDAADNTLARTLTIAGIGAVVAGGAFVVVTLVRRARRTGGKA